MFIHGVSATDGWFLGDPYVALLLPSNSLHRPTPTGPVIDGEWPP
jgi:hypothetical protein